jgi:hypothetical protein
MKRAAAQRVRRKLKKLRDELNKSCSSPAADVSSNSEPPTPPIPSVSSVNGCCSDVQSAIKSEPLDLQVWTDDLNDTKSESAQDLSDDLNAIKSEPLQDFSEDLSAIKSEPEDSSDELPAPVSVMLNRDAVGSVCEWSFYNNRKIFYFFIFVFSASTAEFQLELPPDVPPSYRWLYGKLLTCLFVCFIW